MCQALKAQRGFKANVVRQWKGYDASGENLWSVVHAAAPPLKIIWL